MTVAVIDIGSNTIRLSVYRIENGSFTRLISRKSMAGLAGYVEDGVLTQAGIERAIRSLTDLRNLLELIAVDRTAVFATASLRGIDNQAQALAAIEDATGLPIEVLSGEDEALLDLAGLQYETGLLEGALCDIGGGSAEVVRFRDGVAEKALSVPIGSLKLFRRCVGGLLPTEEEAETIRRTARSVLEEAGVGKLAGNPLLCGIGGTARAAGKLIARKTATDGTTFSREELDRLVDDLCRGTAAFRELVLPICPERVHTIVPGILILQTACDLLGSETVRVGTYGVREGYVCRRML